MCVISCRQSNYTQIELCDLINMIERQQPAYKHSHIKRISYADNWSQFDCESHNHLPVWLLIDFD